MYISCPYLNADGDCVLTGGNCDAVDDSCYIKEDYLRLKKEDKKYGE